jgi:antitoxin ParD1/3/4
MTTITLTLSPELEQKLRESIARQDTETVRQLIADAFAPTVEELLAEKTDAEIDDDEFELIADQLADDVAVCVGSDVLPLSDYAVSREGIYEEHP